MTMTETTVAEPGRETRAYVCGCGHGERITFNVGVAERYIGSICTSFQELKRATS
jgi:hypothetical protein